MERLLISFKQKQFESDISSLQDIIDDMQEIIQIYNSLQLTPFEKDNFNDLFFDTDNFFFKQIMKDKPAEVFGMKINKKKFFDDFLVKPKGYYDLVEAIELLKRKISVRLKHRDENISVKDYLNFFTLDSECKMEIKQSVIDSLREKNETYLYSEKGQLSYELATLIQKFFNKNDNMAKMQITNRRSLEYFIGEAIQFKGENAAVRIEFLTSAIVDR